MTAMAAANAPHVYIVAGEESGDRLGAALIRALRARTDGAIRFSGVGGAHMAAEGVPSLFPLGELAIIGFTAIVASLPNILARIRQTADAVIAAKPDILVIVDSPEFTHRVARRVRARAPQIPIVDYVCPSVWAWRSGRAPAMRAYVDHVLALLPFEPDALKRLGGPSSTYVGHPLIEQVGDLRAADPAARLAEPARLLVLPGSRSGEIRHMARCSARRSAGSRRESSRWKSSSRPCRAWCRRCRRRSPHGPYRCGSSRTWTTSGKPSAPRGRRCPNPAPRLWNWPWPACRW
jgi:lipid-A-disaccharide synthase